MRRDEATTTTTTGSDRCALSFFPQSSAVSIMAERDSTGAAKRRRDRRLRMHWRHEQLTLRMALAECQQPNGIRSFKQAPVPCYFE